MDLAKLVGSMAVVLGIAVAAGHALGEEDRDAPPPAAAPKVTVQKRLEEREAHRRAEMAAQQKRKEEFSRRCSSSALRSEQDVQACRVAYRRL